MTHERQTFRQLFRLRVRWAEVDMQKIVFNGHYLMYFDTAMSEYWRALAVPYESAFAQLGGDLYVKKASLEYFASARYDDLLDIGLRLERVGNSSITYSGAIFRGNDLLIGTELIYVYADPATQRPQPVPQALRALLEGYENGLAATHCAIEPWDAIREDVTALRHAVFVQEQGVDAALAVDAADLQAVHATVRNGLGRVVASGRLVQQAPGIARIGRMAVDRVLRGSRLGEQVLKALVHAARSRGDHEVMMHAQTSAQAFYERLGFVTRGDGFTEAGIAHIEMTQALR